MTKKDFIVIAKALNKARNHMPVPVFIQLVNDISAHCRTTNPAFDKEKFRESCERTTS